VLLEKQPVEINTPEALDKFFAQHRPKFLASVQRRMSPKLTARLDLEAILNDALFKASKGWADFQPPAENRDGACYAWLHEIVLNCFRDARDHAYAKRRDLRKEQNLPDSSSLLAKLGGNAARTGPSTAAARQEQEQRMHEMLERLSPKDRALVTLRDLQGQSFAQVAAHLQIDERYVRSYHCRALCRLRKLWQETYPSDWQQP
jgi:RNA polymerase sigma-70 factor (ECF subfamily)